jgi:predicted hotdog family 3-hydroxylacyl-ACP dehydratase
VKKPNVFPVTGNPAEKAGHSITDVKKENSPIFPVADLLSHTGSALLLDQLLDYGDDWIEAEVCHRKNSLYADIDGNTPAWVGIEYMVQTIGAFAGLENRQRQKPIKLGLLLGTRTFYAYVDFFPANGTIKVRAELRFRNDENMTMFACTITDRANNLLAEAEIKAIQPESIEGLLHA